MTIIVTGRNLDQTVAEDAFRDACQYLRQSRFAAFVLNELMTVPQLLLVEVTNHPGSLNHGAWRPPRRGETNGAGHLLWNLTSASRASADNVTAGEPVDTLPARALAHELGHAYHHLAERSAYLRHLSQAMRQQLDRLDIESIDSILAQQLRDKKYPKALDHFTH